MRAIKKGDFIKVIAAMLTIALVWRAREKLIQYNAEKYCGMNTTVFRSPVNTAYDIVHYAQACGLDGSSYDEIRLKSKTRPYKQKTFFRYRLAQNLIHSNEDALPHVHWITQHEVNIDVNSVESVDYRFGEVRNIKIDYKLNGKDEHDATNIDTWKKLGLDIGWHEIKNEPNIVYVDGK